MIHKELYDLMIKAENDIFQILKDIETKTGRTINRAQLETIDITRIGSSRPECYRSFRISLMPRIGK